MAHRALAAEPTRARRRLAALPQASPCEPLLRCIRQGDAEAVVPFRRQPRSASRATAQNRARCARDGTAAPRTRGSARGRTEPRRRSVVGFWPRRTYFIATSGCQPGLTGHSDLHKRLRRFAPQRAGAAICPVFAMCFVSCRPVETVYLGKPGEMPASCSGRNGNCSASIRNVHRRTAKPWSPSGRRDAPSPRAPSA